jgi:hypothetical protein
MPNINTILSRLPKFNNTVTVIEDQQTVDDIIWGILTWHKKYKSQYDKIYSYFLGKTAKESAKNVFDFVKDNIPYEMEGEKTQSLRSPAAILNDIGYVDCKNMALFVAGVLDAITRNTEQKIPLAFRFASYSSFDKDPGHVFVVMYPGTTKEIWVDPVLDYFNEQKEPTFFLDKKINNNAMSLIAIAGPGRNRTAAGFPSISAAVSNFARRGTIGDDLSYTTDYSIDDPNQNPVPGIDVQQGVYQGNDVTPTNPNSVDNFQLTQNADGSFTDLEGYTYQANSDGTYTDQQGNIVDSQGNINLTLNPDGSYTDNEGYTYTKNADGTFTDQQGQIVNSELTPLIKQPGGSSLPSNMNNQTIGPTPQNKNTQLAPNLNNTLANLLKSLIPGQTATTPAVVRPGTRVTPIPGTKSGISTNTLLLIGAAGLGIYFLSKNRK